MVATGVTGVSFEGLEIRHARGGGVLLKDCTDTVLKGCTVSQHGRCGLRMGSDMIRIITHSLTHSS